MVDLVEFIRNNSAVNSMEETNNYYYTHHNCKSGGQSKVQLNYTLATDLDDGIVRFGICSECGKCFYHKDHESKAF